MDITVLQLRNAADSIKSAADWLEKTYCETTPASAPTPVITLEALRKVLSEKSRNGHTSEIRELLKSYGTDRLSAVDPSHYQEILEKAEGMTDAA